MRERRQSGRSIVLDFQAMNIHTGTYVRRNRKKPSE
jgi:hypothetical protein